MMKYYVHLFLFINIFNFAYAEENQCNWNIFLDELTSTDSNWVVVRDKSEFKPILELIISDSIVWLSTYGSDAFPVQLQNVGSSVIIKNIIFRRELSDPSDDMKLIRPYRSEDMRYQLKLPSHSCSLNGVLLIEISNSKNEQVEILNFVRE